MLISSLLTTSHASSSSIASSFDAITACSVCSSSVICWMHCDDDCRFASFSISSARRRFSSATAAPSRLLSSSFALRSCDTSDDHWCFIDRCFCSIRLDCAWSALLMELWLAIDACSASRSCVTASTVRFSSSTLKRSLRSVSNRPSTLRRTLSIVSFISATFTLSSSRSRSVLSRSPITRVHSSSSLFSVVCACASSLCDATACFSCSLRPSFSSRSSWTRASTLFSASVMLSSFTSANSLHCANQSSSRSRSPVSSSLRVIAHHHSH